MVVFGVTLIASEIYWDWHMGTNSSVVTWRVAGLISPTKMPWGPVSVLSRGSREPQYAARLSKRIWGLWICPRAI